MKNINIFSIIGLVVTLIFTSSPMCIAYASPHDKKISDYLNLPLFFEANNGQAPTQIKFLAIGSTYNMLISDNEIVMKIFNKHENPEFNNQENSSNNKYRIPYNSVAVHMQFVGRNLKSKLMGFDEKPSKSHYFIGDDPNHWTTFVPHYGKVIFKNVYNGVDALFYTKNKNMEYDLVIASGVDPSVIRIAFEGAKSISLDEYGNLIIHTLIGDIIQRKPHVYQIINNLKHDIVGHYKLISQNEIGFSVGFYKTSVPLIIDPSIEYSTYIGGNDVDKGHSIAIDSTGNIYIAGWTHSKDFLAKPKHPPLPWENRKYGHNDCFITKFNSGDLDVVYSLYLGASNNDGCNSIALGTSGVHGASEVFVTGETLSTRFPTTKKAYMPERPLDGPGYLAFVTKFYEDVEGQPRLGYSTYLGAVPDNDRGKAIAVDVAGNAYIAGETESKDFPTQPSNAFQRTITGIGNDAFIAKLNPHGDKLIFSTYIGGAENDTANSIAVDALGNAYIVGTTYSTATFPKKYGGGGPPQWWMWSCLGNPCGFISKLNHSGTALLYSYYIGGRGFTIANSLTLDGGCNVFVTGETDHFPVWSDIQWNYGGGSSDAFVAKYDSFGMYIAGTYIGGAGRESGKSIALDSKGNILVTGVTQSKNFPVDQAIQSTIRGYQDAFIAKLSDVSNDLLFSSYLGGDGPDSGEGILGDASEDIYVVGATSSKNFPLKDAVQSYYAGNSDVFLTKLSGIRHSNQGKGGIEKTFDPSKCQYHWYRMLNQASCKKWDDLLKSMEKTAPFQQQKVVDP
jgi:hypothetical protein